MAKRAAPDKILSLRMTRRFWRIRAADFALGNHHSVRSRTRRAAAEPVLGCTQFSACPIHCFGNAVWTVAGQVPSKRISENPAPGPFCIARQLVGASKELFGNGNRRFHNFVSLLGSRIKERRKPIAKYEGPVWLGARDHS